jgi:hypothetical protein
MSQSDYIGHKKIANILKHQEKLDNVLNSQEYTQFKTFALANTIVDSNITYNGIVPGTRQNVFGMEMEVSGNCPNMVFCTDTNSRANRVGQNLQMFPHYRGNVSKNGSYWDRKTKHLLCLQKQFEECDNFLYRRKIWFKKVGR